MADRFPLIVNAVSQKIEEIVAGDNLELTGNGLIISGDSGAGKYLSSNGSTVFWGEPGNVYLTQTQTLTNKTIEDSIISGSNNTLTNIPNSALINSTISVNGNTVALGGSVTTPNDNTTYAISAQDGTTAASKQIRLTGSNPTSEDNIIIAVGAPPSVPAGSNALSLLLSRVGETITISGHVVDNNTITTLQAATGGTAQSGAITIAATGSSTVSQDAASRTITINSTYIDTITRLRATTGQVYAASDFTFLASGATSVAQGVDGVGDPTITYSSTDTVTRVKGGGAGTFTTGDVEITGGAGGNVTVAQSGTTITIDSVDTNTVTRLSSGGNSVQAGDFNFIASGAASISQSTNAGVTTIEISSQNDDTGASLGAPANGGLILQGTNFRIKNYNNFTGNTVLKWDSGNSQLTNSLITDNGSTVTIDGDLVVEGTQTILNTTTLQVEDNSIELRKGNGLTGANGGIQLNRTSDASGNITSFISIDWNESSGYWRSWDGSVENRFVTENETQVLTNKTLTSPTLTGPILGSATATAINGLVISTTASATLDIASSKTLDVDRDLTLTSDNNSSAINVNFRQGGNVAYTSDTLATFASTTSTQMRGLVSDTTGTGKMVFNDSPTIVNSIASTSAGFTLLNAGVANIQFGGGAGSITIGDTTDAGITNVRHNLLVDKDLTVGAAAGGDTFLCNATFNSENADILVRGTATDPMHIGRGGGAVSSNTRVGSRALENNTSGSQNVAVGYQALFTTNSGAGNVGIGHRCLRANGIGSNNIGIGRDVLLVNLDGDKNVAIGNNALEQNTTGNSNVCIGHYAGFDVFGDGNVLIGPADNENSGDATFRPPNISGDRQLVIGSGGQAWIRGDANYDVTFNNDVTIDVDLTVKGNLNVLGTQTITESNVVRIADKNIELAFAVSRQFVATTVSGSDTITGITPTAGLIPGMVVSTGTTGIVIPTNTTIVSITNNTAVLSNAVTGSGQATIDAIGPSDTSAVDGGMIVKGTTDKSILWKGSDAGVTYNTWVSSENFDLASGKHFSLNNVRVADPDTLTIGPNAGTNSGDGEIDIAGGATGYTLGSALVGAGANLFNFTGTGQIKLPAGSDNQRAGAANQPTALVGMMRYNTQSHAFEGYAGASGSETWANIGGTVQVSQSAPTTDVQGTLWYDSDDGRLFLYYNDGNTSQWVDASPAAVPGFDSVSSNILPQTDATFDLGSTTKRWANIYSADLQLSNEGGANDVDGTWGQYTIQEGEHDLFLINRRSGKKYKFNLTEVN